MAILLPVNFGTRTDAVYARWLKRQITFGWISYEVIRIRTKEILAHGTESKVLNWKVRTSWSYCFEELLLSLWPYYCEGLHVLSLLNLNTCFIREQVFLKQPSWVRGNSWFRTRM